jgi:predicted NAD-dependent protein-ADP-ribosyltransferase YbiA (DUF1768 family)
MTVPFCYEEHFIKTLAFYSLQFQSLPDQENIMQIRNYINEKIWGIGEQVSGNNNLGRRNRVVDEKVNEATRQ